MVYIIIKTFYPTCKAEEVTEIYQKMLKKYPPDPSLSDRVVPVAARATEKGVESMSIQKLKEGKFDDVAKNIIASMAMFHPVEGFGYSVEIWSTLEESLAAGR